jgi:hypothetical protein
MEDMIEKSGLSSMKILSQVVQSFGRMKESRSYSPGDDVTVFVSTH